ncbi:MAG: hypothetical protein DRP01_07870 [Archaeoglobales archaeon]|nr:MAG: hypothetical protein DRP01_07870 [Archaeoglobales archaeon]
MAKIRLTFNDLTPEKYGVNVLIRYFQILENSIACYIFDTKSSELTIEWSILKNIPEDIINFLIRRIHLKAIVYTPSKVFNEDWSTRNIHPCGWFNMDDSYYQLYTPDLLSKIANVWVIEGTPTRGILVEFTISDMEYNLIHLITPWENAYIIYDYKFDYSDRNGLWDYLKEKSLV